MIEILPGTNWCGPVFRRELAAKGAMSQLKGTTQGEDEQNVARNVLDMGVRILAGISSADYPNFPFEIDQDSA